MLQFEPGLAIWTIITFLVLFFGLLKTAWPKILSALDARETTIRSSLEEAEKAKSEAERIMAEYKDLVAKANQESAEIIKKGTQQAEKVREDLIAKAKEDANKLVDNAKKEMELERDKAIQEMRAKVVDISIAIATKILEESLTKQKQVEIAKKALQEMELN